MTRKDFELIATILRTEREACQTVHGKQAIANVAETFARNLLNTNERFNRGKFLKACGVI